MGLHLASSGEFVSNFKSQKHVSLHFVIFPFANIYVYFRHINLVILLPSFGSTLSNLFLFIDSIGSFLFFETLVCDTVISAYLTVGAIRLG